MTTPVGPLSFGAASPLSFTARRASEFLMTTYPTPALRKLRRSSVMFFRSDDDAGGALELRRRESALVHGAQSQRVLDDHVSDAGLAKAPAQFGHVLHVEAREVGVVERVGALHLLLEPSDELLFLGSFHRSLPVRCGVDTHTRAHRAGDGDRLH